MKWRSDPYWRDALAAAMCLSAEHRMVLTPDEFGGEREDFFSIRRIPVYAAGGVTAFVLQKDQAGLLPSAILRSVGGRFRCVYASEVFVIYSALPETLSVTEEMEKHIPFFLEQCRQCLEQREESGDACGAGKNALPYLLDTQKNRILQTMFPNQHFVSEQFDGLSGAPAALKREVFKYCVSDVRLELSAFCNRSCDYCPVSFLPKRKDLAERMPWELFSKCVDELAEIGYDKAIWFCLFNEPLCDREYLFRALDHTDRMLPNCYIKIVSNGDYLTKEYFRALTEHRIDEFSISVHYSGTWDRDRQWERIREILARAGIPEQGEPAENDRRIIYYVDPAAYDSSKVRSVVLRTEDFAVHGMDRAGALDSGVLRAHNLDHCDFPFTQFNLSYDGTVVPCCNICSDVPGAKEWCYGPLQDNESIFDAYACSRAAWFRRRLFAPRKEGEYTPELCRTCAVGEYDIAEKLYRQDDERRREIYELWMPGSERREQFV